MKKLPQRKFHKTPRLLWSDAYTINGSSFESKEATENSRYYGTFRKFPHAHEPFYSPEDTRIVFAGLQQLCDILFYNPITTAEIDETVDFLKDRKVKYNGEFEDFEFPEAMWRRVVKDFGGYLPLRVVGMPEGSVVYPHEPFLRVEATEPGFGPLVPWFESTLLHAWAATERLTAGRHFLKHTYNLIRNFEPENVTDDECMFFARLMIHDFGDRAAASPMESELVGRVHNYVWFGTDTFRAAYQNWKNGAPPAYGSSVKALAHRIVQGFSLEGDCYENMYDTAGKHELLSMVGDCYDYWSALENHLIPLALRAQADGSGKCVVARPDCYDDKTMIMTQGGWKFFRELKETDQVAQINDNLTMEFVKPLKYIEQDYCGEMVHFYGDHDKVDLFVTPNHRMVWDWKNQIKIQSANESKVNNAYRKLIRTAKMPDLNKKLSWWERLAIAFQADGSFATIKNKGIRNNKQVLRFNFTKERKAKRLEWICKNGNFDFSIHREPARLKNYNMYVWIDNEPDKNFSWVTQISNMCSNWCKEFIEEVSYWDATRRSEIRYKFDTTNESVINIIEKIALAAGYGCLITEKTDNRKEIFSNVFTANILTRGNKITTQAINKSFIHYKGKVYCVTVPSGKLLVKRNRATAISGNSGDSTDMVVGTLQKARQAGLMAEHLCSDGVTRHISTTLRFIVGNGESFDSVLQITNAVLDAGFVPWRCGIFGVGGHLRNNINRDHLSTKFALCSVGNNNRPVIKLSNSPGKQTLPECMVLRDEIALTSGVTLAAPGELGEDALVPYYDGSRDEPFGSGFTDDFMTCEARVIKEFDEMPLTAGRRSDLLQIEVESLINRYRR